MKIKKVIFKEKGFDLLSNSLIYSLRRCKEIRMENVSVNIRLLTLKGVKDSEYFIFLIYSAINSNYTGW